ncbi:hypothetical protein HPB49_015473 [Dermacentor silvarum]|uniref:Uncharacterized protein n=1 Tax=Dermacentor silvarum TaxID=543639 RepID=A0ACB8CY62_DERSI|nr:hypothetical protein HPB49_015473 [Dermacentor silvarum]
MYLLYVSGVERALLQSGLGFGLRYTTSGIDDNRRIPGLAYADDLLLMAESPRDMQSLLDICANEMKKLGLRFNAQKTTVVQLAGKLVEGTVLRLGEEVLQIASAVKYLGVNLCNGKDLYGLHEEKVGQTALRAQCILRRRCLCNRFVMIRDLWKLVHVPALTFGNAVVCLTAKGRDELERRQREVGRIAVGCHGTVANEAVQGELGWSSFAAREASSKLAFYNRLLHMHRDRWARRVFDYLSATCLRTQWTRRVHHLKQKNGLIRDPMLAQSIGAYAKAVQQRVRDVEESSIKATRLYDNSVGSALLFEARAGALRTLTRQRAFDSTVTCVLCRSCGKSDETIEHLVLQCDELGESESQTALAVALGFEDTEGEVQAAAVSRTKRRLEQWRTATQQCRRLPTASVEDRGGSIRDSVCAP